MLYITGSSSGHYADAGRHSFEEQGRRPPGEPLEAAGSGI